MAFNGLPPGIAGYAAGQELGQRRDMAQMQQLQGILGLQAALEDREFTRQLKPLQVEQMQMALQKAKLQQQALSDYAAQQGQGAAQAGMTAGAQVGDIGPTVTNAQRVGGGGAMPNFEALIAGGIPPETVKAFMESWKLRNPELKFEGGLPRDPRTGMIRDGIPAAPHTNQQGFSTTPRFNPATGQVEIGVTPGSAEAYATQQRIQQGTQADFDVMQIPGALVQTRGEFVRGRQQPPALPPPIPGGGAPPPLADQLAGRPPAEQEAIRRLQAAGGKPTTVTVPPQAGEGGPLPAPLYTPTAAQAAADKARAEAAVKRENEAPDASQRVGSLTDNIDRMIKNANSIINNPALSRSVGLYGALPSVPGGKAADLDATIESFKAQISGSVLQSMRDMSKTGGAVGNVTEKEWPRLEGMLGALHAKMSPEAFREAAGNIIKELQVSRGRITDAYSQEFGKTPGAVAPASREQILRRYNPATGKIE